MMPIVERSTWNMLALLAASVAMQVGPNSGASKRNPAISSERMRWKTSLMRDTVRSIMSPARSRWCRAM